MIIQDLINKKIPFAVVTGDVGNEDGVYCLAVFAGYADNISAQGTYRSTSTHIRYAHRDLIPAEILELRELRFRGKMKIKGRYADGGIMTTVYVPANGAELTSNEKNRIRTVEDYMVK